LEKPQAEHYVNGGGKLGIMFSKGTKKLSNREFLKPAMGEPRRGAENQGGRKFWEIWGQSKRGVGKRYRARSLGTDQKFKTAKRAPSKQNRRKGAKK